MSGPFVYILRCSDGSYYVGLAQTDLDRRIGEHQSGHYRGYTHSRRSVELLWAMGYERYDQAIAFERQLKGWAGPRRMRSRAAISSG
ncbi:GIY-YIG nuclease family protein [Pinisolibacter aquiterrae]|uniref:GIY-YIG nuclease family protein n=1 Tax=Pinisolibacter aquiterrae TaxID=2815579 RepID=UPI0030844F0D